MAEIQIPCVKLPKLPKIPSITLIGGIELQGFLDFSAGMPTQCGATLSLMTQLAPALGGLTVVLKILAVLKALKTTVESVFLETGDLIAALADLAPLFLALTPAGMAVTIKGILELILSFLTCVIGQLESAIQFQASLTLPADLAGPDVEVSLVLKASLACAQANAELAVAHAAAALGPVEPLLDLAGMLAGIAGISLELPDLSGAAGADAAAAVTQMKQAVEKLQAVVEGLPL